MAQTPALVPSATACGCCVPGWFKHCGVDGWTLRLNPQINVCLSCVKRFSIRAHPSPLALNLLVVAHLQVPFMIDSSKFPIVEAGLKWVQGKSIVNSISLKVSGFSSGLRASLLSKQSSNAHPDGFAMPRPRLTALVLTPCSHKTAPEAPIDVSRHKLPRFR